MKLIICMLSVAFIEQAISKPRTEYYVTNSEIDEYIVNGNDVEKGRWPWMLSLEVLDPEFRHTCGATLLDERHALTAAHCLDGRFPTMDFRVVVGASHRGDDETPSDREDTVNVVAAVLHEDYNCNITSGCIGAYPNDIAVMYLEREVEMNDAVQGAILGNNSIEYYLDKECYSSGWGKLDGTEDDVPVKLQEIEIEVLTIDNCRDLMRVGGNINVQPGPHVCIFDERNVTDDEKRGICQGDSGGPLQCLNDDGTWEVLGAASWVIGGPIPSTCNPAYPGVYAFSVTYLDWIQSQIDDPSWKPSVQI